MVADLKSAGRKPRGFESLALRHTNSESHRKKWCVKRVPAGDIFTHRLYWNISGTALQGLQSLLKVIPGNRIRSSLFPRSFPFQQSLSMHLRFPPAGSSARNILKGVHQSLSIFLICFATHSCRLISKSIFSSMATPLPFEQIPYLCSPARHFRIALAPGSSSLHAKNFRAKATVIAYFRNRIQAPALSASRIRFRNSTALPAVLRFITTPPDRLRNCMGKRGTW